MKYVLSNSKSVQCNFFIFDHVTFIQFKICCCVQISSKSDDFSLTYGGISIFKLAAVRQFENRFTTIRDHSRSLLLATAACQISSQSHTQISRYSYLNLSHIWLEIPIQAPKMGVLGNFGHLNVIIHHHRDPQKAHPCVLIVCAYHYASCTQTAITVF